MKCNCWVEPLRQHERTRPRSSFTLTPLQAILAKVVDLPPGPVLGAVHHQAEETHLRRDLVLPVGSLDQVADQSSLGQEHDPSQRVAKVGQAGDPHLPEDPVPRALKCQAKLEGSCLR